MPGWIALLLLACPAAGSGPPFGNPSKLAPTGFPVVVTDSAGTWAVAWPDTLSNDALVYCRSWDGGATWSKPKPIAGESGRDLDVATAASWVAAWVGVPGGVFVVRSPDGGRTWDAPIALDMQGRGVRVATDRQGTWVATWVTPEASSDHVMVARSTDDGASWSAPIALFDAPSGTRVEPGRVASGGGGTWLAAWRQGPTGNDAVAVSRSVDGAATWKTAPLIASPAAGPLDLGADGTGAWLLVWTGAKQSLEFPFIVQDATVVVSRSSDDGRSWTVATPLDPNGPRRLKSLFTGRFDRDVQIANDGPQRWLAVWNSAVLRDGRDQFSDVLVSHSTNGGINWTMPERVNGGIDDPDRAHLTPRIANDPARGTVVAWSSNDSLLGGIRPADPFGVLVARSIGCAPQPLAGCEVARPSLATLAINHGPATARFKWVWSGSSSGDFGDPIVADDHFLCVYGSDTGGPLLFESALPAGGFCGSRRCWTSERFGSFVYRGAGGYPARADRARVVTRAGRAWIAVAGAGIHLTTGAVPFPALPATLPVRVQLQGSGGTCWESLHRDAETSTATRLVSGSD